MINDRNTIYSVIEFQKVQKQKNQYNRSKSKANNGCNEVNNAEIELICNHKSEISR
ncbi:hypothetical protein MACJ_003874 [Theileria orientalis]|uniref:Uncharacterized protein n=1 Tax=Theileria orientalis TaxID=68886 RepID=A0A976XJD5_THEOR|nr:hypothetical protein MACJ_003874 [Theileria orientalis]